jgi:hypothetical protein
VAFPARSIARATACAIEQPAEAEIVTRPTAQDFWDRAEAERSLKTRRYSFRYVELSIVLAFTAWVPT